MLAIHHNELTELVYMHLYSFSLCGVKVPIYHNLPSLHYVLQPFSGYVLIQIQITIKNSFMNKRNLYQNNMNKKWKCFINNGAAVSVR